MEPESCIPDDIRELDLRWKGFDNVETRTKITHLTKMNAWLSSYFQEFFHVY